MLVRFLPRSETPVSTTGVEWSVWTWRRYVSRTKDTSLGTGQAWIFWIGPEGTGSRQGEHAACSV